MLTTRQVKRKTESGEAKNYLHIQSNERKKEGERREEQQQHHHHHQVNGIQIKTEFSVSDKKKQKTEHIHDESKVDFAVAIC